MNKYVAILAVLLAGLVILAGCAQYGPTDANKTAGVSIQNNPDSGITIKDFAFSPPILTVKVHTSVNWTNLDSATHKIMVDNFQSPNINQGGVFKYTFDTVGTYPYYCTIHPSMKGTIIVE